MPNSNTSTVTRYRPAVLFLTGAAAAYAAYLVYNVIQSSPDAGLHRSNAVRARRSRRRPTSSADALSWIPPGEQRRLDLGNYDLPGTTVPLSTDNIVPVSELRDIITSGNPEASPETVESTIAEVYDSFLDRLFALVFPHQLPLDVEIEAIRGWIGDSIPDNTATIRAARRHAERYVRASDSVDPLGVDVAESVAPTEVSWGTDDDTEGDAIDPDGQTLQRTLYHIAEDRAKQEGVVHRGITCNGCDEKPIRGIRWHCANCIDFDLCSNCEATNSHYKTHIFYKIRVPAPYLGLPQQESLYPGKPHMMSPSIDPALKKRLVAATKMEVEEVEALWDQFTCLAGTEWVEDKSGVGWAMDRRAFNHAFVPRYNSFVAAPNLIYDRIFAYYDTDKNGYIGFDEWIKGLDGMHTSDIEVKARIVFNGYDIDGDGFISRKDILRLFRAYYAIEKEAARNYIAELTEELSVRNALETIRSSQPLGSAFPPNSASTLPPGNLRLREKQVEDEKLPSPIVEGDEPDVATREDVLKSTNVYNIVPGELTQADQNRIIADRWSRRQFYVDEEEGLERPGGAEEATSMSTSSFCPDTITSTDGSPHASCVRSARPRSSSRFRFDDRVDAETRSNASTPSRPVGERWGGYEVPEPEKDLGKEVLYQITQQGFNELLDPLFQEKEDMAMDAFETRSERRKCASIIDRTLSTFESAKSDLESINRMGFFRYANCMVHRFCEGLRSGTRMTLRSFLQNSDTTVSDYTDAREKLATLYAKIEVATLRVASNTSTTTKLDQLSLWHTQLYRQRVRKEILDATMDCCQELAWFAPNEVSRKSVDHVFADIFQNIARDPTMPQFRPNTITDLPLSQDHVEDDRSDSTASSHADSLVAYSHIGLETTVSYPRGPFFALATPDGKDPDSKDEVDTEDAPTTSRTSETVGPPSTADSPILTLADQESVGDQRSASRLADYIDSPYIHLFYIDSSCGFDSLKFRAKPIVHSLNPFHPETDQVKPLIRYIRQLAMDPDSNSHSTLLASLEFVEQEISERKGSGLINFEEFSGHMRQGKLRFLESWLEWVSI
ncbi:hypothetical protein ACN47E_006283 [Coniothyrium glycines]